jgi:2-alkenal reductase
LEVGDTVLAIGSPFGERWTLTSGIVSALDRTIRSMGNFSTGGVIQTDAAINPGNSGGPLLNVNGEVIGVNSQIVSASGSSAGIGFAVPGNLTQRNTQMLIDRGTVEYSFLGINGSNVSLELMEALGLPNNTQGVVVSGITPGGPAARAGLQPLQISRTANSGLATPEQVDIITAIDGTSLSGMDALISYLAQQTQPGDSVTLTVLRNGSQAINLTATLTPRP